jgi:transposase
MQAVTIGLDIAKSLFQVHAVDSRGNVIIRRQLKRRQVLPFFKKLPSSLWDRGLRNVALLGARCALIRGGHYGQRSCEPHQQAEHMAAPTRLRHGP